MVGRTALAAVAASALVFAGGGLAYADNDFPDADSSLIEVYVQSESDIDKLVADGFDLAEYKHVEDDGTIVVAIDADAAERARAARSAASRIGAHDRGRRDRAAVAAERDAPARARQPRRATTPRTACRRGPSSRASRRPTPGETVIQRANKFTNYAGTFLYVEAHNKAIIRTGAPAHVHRPDAARWRSRAPTASTARPTQHGRASSTPTRRRTSTCTTGS